MSKENKPKDQLDSALLDKLGYVSLGDVAPLLGLSAETANEQASRNQLPVPVIRVGKTKSPWLVPTESLKTYMGKKAKQAFKDLSLREPA